VIGINGRTAAMAVLADTPDGRRPPGV
jgi:hypothetical protein